MMLPQISTLPLELEMTPPLSLLPLTLKVTLPPLEVTQSLLLLDVVLPPSLGAPLHTLELLPCLLCTSPLLFDTLENYLLSQAANGFSTAMQAPLSESIKILGSFSLLRITGLHGTSTQKSL
jgi:hypothetical protein